MWRMRRWVNVSPRKDTRCALRELTRESRVPAMKHGTLKNVRETDDWHEEGQINGEGKKKEERVL